MEELLLVAEVDEQRFEIVKDSLVGYYVYRWVEQGKRCTHDYLQDDLEMAMSCAEDKFGVRQSIWREAKTGEKPTCLSE
jgi:hypothetical protein